MADRQPPAGGTSSSHAVALALAHLQAQYQDADPLLLQLAAHAANRNRSDTWHDLSTADRQEVNRATDAAHDLVWDWAPHSPSGFEVRARWALTGAVTAILIEATQPELADELGASWADAVSARHELADLGLVAESAAERLIPQWRLPIANLPGAIKALVS